MTTDRITLGDGRTLAFDEYGDPGGRPLLYFHGWPSSRLEAAVIEAAAQRQGVRVVAPDRPGFGLSTFRPHRRLTDWPGDVIELADALHLEEFDVLGWSGGGPYVAVCAWKIADRLRAAGIVSGQGPPDLPDALAEMRGRNRLLLQLGRRAGWMARPLLWRARRAIERRPAPFFDELVTDLPPADRDLLTQPEQRERLRRTALEAFRGGLRGAVQENAIYARPWGFELRDVTHPLLLWHGELDVNAPPAFARHLAAAVPHSRATFHPDEGHAAVLINHADEILRTLGS